jgi:DNA topoisomerase-1
MTFQMPCDDLRFVHDSTPGVSRRRSGKGFTYVDVDGNRISDSRTLTRIRKLAIPPAWQHVWICPDARGHIQAIGWDARGRKQYRYHDRWREARDEEKFARLGDFGKALPTIREAVDAELSARSISRQRVLAGVVALLDRTLMRVGTPRYVAENQSFGLTTLRNSHATVSGGRVVFSYRGKSGVRQRSVVSDRKLATLVRRCQELPGQTLFQWADNDGELHPIGSADVNDYLRELTDAEFTAKDFRTWGASTCVAGHLALVDEVPTAERARKLIVNAAIDQAAQLLGNTRAVCRSSYVHPTVIEAFADGRLATAAPSARRGRAAEYLSRDECLLLDVL